MIKKLKIKIIKYFTDLGHTFDHTERVYTMAIRLAKDEKADLEIVKAAALLHDVGRAKENPKLGICHAEESAKMAPKILKLIKFPEKKIPAVLHCIKSHRYSKKLKAETKEAQIIQDADRLDALGPITVARIFSYGAMKGRILHDPKIKPGKKYPPKPKTKTSINHFYHKILKIKPNTFKTKLARKIAKERYKFTKDYVEKFEKQWKGEF